MPKDSGYDTQPACHNYLSDFSVFLQVVRNKNFFVPETCNQRVYDYLHLDRSQTTFNPAVDIPIGSGYVRYAGHEIGGVNDRPLGLYQQMLFPDDFTDEILSDELPLGWSPECMLRQSKKRDNPTSTFGGYQEAFAPCKTILDIGSGQAYALFQLALSNQRTSFIGIDVLYHQKMKVYPKLPGLQLTQGSWLDLRPVPDKSIDTIISCQSVGMWGLPLEKNREEIVTAWERVAKQGAVLRVDVSDRGVIDYLVQRMGNKGWDLRPLNYCLIARRR